MPLKVLSEVCSVLSVGIIIEVIKPLNASIASEDSDLSANCGSEYKRLVITERTFGMRRGLVSERVLRSAKSVSTVILARGLDALLRVRVSAKRLYLRDVCSKKVKDGVWVEERRRR